MFDYSKVHKWWPDRQLGDWAPVPPESEIELRNAIDAAWHLSRAFKNGYIQQESVEERRRWAADAASLLAMLATALRDRLPAEGTSPRMERIAHVNLRIRAIQEADQGAGSNDANPS